jgi:hypothetical protein
MENLYNVLKANHDRINAQEVEHKRVQDERIAREKSERSRLVAETLADFFRRQQLCTERVVFETEQRVNSGNYAVDGRQVSMLFYPAPKECTIFTFSEGEIKKRLNGLSKLVASASYDDQSVRILTTTLLPWLWG